jgi:hypothetical protein
MKIIIEITEAQALGLGYLAGIDCRSRKNYIENVLKRHLYENEDLIEEATIKKMIELQRAGYLRAETEGSGSQDQSGGKV